MTSDANEWLATLSLSMLRWISISFIKPRDFRYNVDIFKIRQAVYVPADIYIYTKAWHVVCSVRVVFLSSSYVYTTNIFFSSYNYKMRRSETPEHNILCERYTKFYQAMYHINLNKKKSSRTNDTF